MAMPTKSLEYHFRYVDAPAAFRWRLGTMAARKTVILMSVFSILTFVGAFYYVQQQVRLRSLNYEIIELKRQKQALTEQSKTLQLRLDQAKQLDLIEKELRKQGFVPLQKDQIRIIE